ncbi:MAG: putative motility protein [Epsilonproteobacteria bacterium]|nr:putative motility protein [Campylobacterota bacterium]
MEISSTTPAVQNDTQSSSATPLKKAIDVQEKQIEQIIESAQEQSKQTTAQKTGIGGNINLTA